MPRIRVYELAKELGKENKEMETLIRDLGIEVKGVMSQIEWDQAQLVRRHLTPASRLEPTARPTTLSAPDPQSPVPPGPMVIRRRGIEICPSTNDEILPAPPLSSPTRKIPIATVPDHRAVTLQPKPPPRQPFAENNDESREHRRRSYRSVKPSTTPDRRPVTHPPRPPWDRLLQQARSENAQERRMSVVDACEALRRALKSCGVPGNKANELLLETPAHVEITTKQLADAVRANQRRNEVAHDNAVLDIDEAIQIVRAFESVASAVRDSNTSTTGDHNGSRGRTDRRG